MAEKLIQLKKKSGPPKNNILQVDDAHWHYYTYSGSFVEHKNETIQKGTYYQNIYDRGVINLKKANVSTIKVYNAARISPASFNMLAIDAQGNIYNYNAGDCMTEYTRSVGSSIEYIFFTCWVTQFRVRFD